MDKLNNFDKRLTKLEKKFHISNKKTSKVTNESECTNEGIASIIAKVAPTVIKNLPLILKVIEELKELFKDDPEKAKALDAIANELPKEKA